jgi:hypothetical protein
MGFFEFLGSLIRTARRVREDRGGADSEDDAKRREEAELDLEEEEEEEEGG